jgi:hypothetical protein
LEQVNPTDLPIVNSFYPPKTVVANRYQIVELLGQGSFGATYAALDRVSGDRVALKTLSLRDIQDWKALDLFDREAKVLATLNHPGIPRYLDYFQIDEDRDRQFCLVQALVAGQSLAQWVEQGWHPSETEVKEIATKILHILHYLHALYPPVIHRDLKPQNIIRAEDGTVSLVDFGAVQEAYRNTISRGGTFVGTLGYMPPEQFRGEAFPASDLYSLGATLVFLLTGQSPTDLPQKRLKIDFRACVTLSPTFADWLDIILEPTVEDRFQSAAEALQHLQRQQLVANSKPPTGSQIVLRKTHQRLEIIIPPVGIRGQTIAIFIFALIWNTAVLPMFLTMLIAGGGGILIFMLPHLSVGLYLLFCVLFAIAGRIKLNFDRQTFKIEWYLFDSLIHSFSGSTPAIKRVEVDVKVGSKGSKTITCAFWEGVKQHKFGRMLARPEQDWLVEQMADFLNLQLN